MTALEDLQQRLRGRYEIERELGRGGMGAVYLARDVRLGRPVALKVLPAEYATQAGLRERFLRETRMAASFSHPNIVPVYAVEESDDLLAFAMGYVEGESVAERVRRTGPLGVRETVRLLQDVGYALAYAHGRGVVHRDIKPDNIMIERATGRALVMDFGVSRAIAATDAPANEGLTRVGEVVGTPEYMSPEQATGDHVDGRSDLYSLGLTAYYAVTGRVAMAADSTGKALVKQITETLPPMLTVRADLPEALAVSIDRCLMKDPNARFANAEALVEAIDAAQLAAPEIPVPIRLFAHRLGGLSMLLFVGGFFAFFMLRGALDAEESSVDGLLPVILLLSVMLSLVVQTFAEARRLAVNGFNPSSVQQGLAAVVDERRALRNELKASPAAQRAWKRTFWCSVGGVVAAAALFRIALLFRHQVALHHYQTGPAGVALVFAAVIVFGMSWAFMIRNPFRMPIGERLFRLVWLGPLGRAFTRVAGSRVERPSAPSGIARAAIVQAPPPVPERPSVAAPSDVLVSLERRVAALERWRKES